MTDKPSEVFDLSMRSKGDSEGDFDKQAALDSINPLKASQSLYLASVLVDLEHRLDLIRQQNISPPPSLLDPLNKFLAGHSTLSVLAQVVKEHSMELSGLADALGCESAVLEVNVDLSLANALKGQNPIEELTSQLRLKWK